VPVGQRAEEPGHRRREGTAKVANVSSRQPDSYGPSPATTHGCTVCTITRPPGASRRAQADSVGAASSASSAKFSTTSANGPAAHVGSAASVS
jgi:hypothetical protein